MVTWQDLIRQTVNYQTNWLSELELRVGGGGGEGGGGVNEMNLDCKNKIPV